MFRRTAALKAAGVLGINQRNADYILKYNRRKLYPLVDDKLRTKEIAISAGISVPELYAVVRVPGELRKLRDLVGQYPDFAIKPARGSGGAGILVIVNHNKGRYRLIDGAILDQAELDFHVTGILSGVYSLGGQPDKALVEYRIKSDPVFDEVLYQGVPDIRIIVFQGVPTMAMIRLPTRRSKGKANLHQGAIGVGIDLATGNTLHAVCGQEVTTEHPDTGKAVGGLQIPRWDEVLRLASRSSELTGLGFQGVDIVLDKHKGALILELNARPGLGIQIANRAGLLPRLELIEAALPDLNTLEARVEFAKSHFGAAVCPQSVQSPCRSNT